MLPSLLMSEKPSSPPRRIHWIPITSALLISAVFCSAGWFGYQYLEQKNLQISHLQQRLNSLEEQEAERRTREEQQLLQTEEKLRDLQAELSRHMQEESTARTKSAQATLKTAEETTRRIVTEQLQKEKAAAERARQELFRKIAEESARKNAPTIKKRKRSSGQTVRRNKVQQTQPATREHLSYPVPQRLRYPLYHFRGPHQPYNPYPHSGYRIIFP